MTRLLSLSITLAACCHAADLAYSTYLRYGFTPTAMTSDSQGNIYVAGNAIVDPLSRTTVAAVAKIDPRTNRYSYLEYLDAAASDTITWAYAGITTSPIRTSSVA